MVLYDARKQRRRERLTSTNKVKSGKYEEEEKKNKKGLIKTKQDKRLKKRWNTIQKPHHPTDQIHQARNR